MWSKWLLVTLYFQKKIDLEWKSFVQQGFYQIAKPLRNHVTFNYIFRVFSTLQVQHYCLWHLKMMLLDNWNEVDIQHALQGAKNGLEAMSAESVEVLIAWHMSVTSTYIYLTQKPKYEESVLLFCSIYFLGNWTYSLLLK